MASIQRRARTDGTVGYRVAWRLGGTRSGAQQSETFDQMPAARDFRRAVEAAGHQWPPGWVPGVGYAPATSDTPASDVPLATWGAAYVEQLTAIGPDTRQRYARQLNALAAWLQPIVGATPTVATLTDVHIRRWVNARESAGAAPKTISNYHGLLYAVMAHAVAKGLRPDNPCSATKLPRHDDDIDTDDEMVFLTEAEFTLLYECIHPDSRDLAAVAVGTGLRFGEISALQPRDLELDASPPRVHVRRAWKRNGTGTYKVAGKDRFYLGKPKSKKSRRTITVSPAVADMLRRVAQGKGPEDFLFVAPRGGRLDQAAFHDNRWSKCVAEAQKRGLTKSPRFHDLRHTHAAWLITAGTPLPVIQQRLGHESITTTVDRYGGLLVQAHEVADAAIDAALRGQAVPVAKQRRTGAA